MRLIDVDKLDLVVHVTTQNNAVCNEIADEVGRQIVNAPTIDAIPVAFIEEKMRKYEELAYQSTPKIQQRYFDKVDALKSLIYYWHEKNEKGDDDATV